MSSPSLWDSRKGLTVPHAAQFYSQQEVPALPQLLSEKWFVWKLPYNWSADLEFSFNSVYVKHVKNIGSHPQTRIQRGSLFLCSALVVCALRCWHTIEPCSLLIGAQCLRWGEQPTVMCCASVKGIGLTTTLPISRGSDGQASHDYMVMGLSQTS